MSDRAAPSRKDRRGVRRRRQRADAEPQRIGLFLPVKRRNSDAADVTLCAHTPDTLPAERTNPRPTRYRAAATDLAFVHVVCRCGDAEVRLRADVAASGYVPRCSIGCRERAVPRAPGGPRRRVPKEDHPCT